MAKFSTNTSATSRLVALIFAAWLGGWLPLERAQSAQPPERRFTKEAMLVDLVGRVIVPAYSNFTERCRELETASQQLSANPDAASLRRAQAAWVAAMLAWRPAQVIRSGPLLDQNILSRIHFWPMRRQSVEKVLRDSRPLTDAYIRELGAPAVGLCAMEFLLFDLKGGDSVVLTAYGTNPSTGSGQDQSERRKTYLHALAVDLTRNARRAVAAWTSPDGYRTKFVAGGQDTVNLVVNDMLQAVEIAVEERLKYALDLHENKLLKPEFIQSAAAGISQRSVAEVLRGAQRIYAGNGGFGLAAQLKQIESPLADRIETQFRTALQQVDGIGMPLEQALPKNREAVSKAYDECKRLEIALKVEMAGALGVTLTFNSTDGD